MNWVNKNTELYGSFAKTAGNVGCQMMNTAFYYYDLNKVYKSFSVDDIESAVSAVRVLDIKGFAITMPYKIEVIPFLDVLSQEVSEIGACNTVLNDKGTLIAYNTDVFAAQEMLSRQDTQKSLFILGDGGYSKAVQYAARSLGFQFVVVMRSNWNIIQEVRNSIVYNCTPVDDIINNMDGSNDFIDCLVDTKTGRNLANIQAGEQFRLYTGKDWIFS